MIERNRQSRDKKLSTIHQHIANYIIFTDTKETEKNYLNGLKGSLPQKLQSAIQLKVISTSTDMLIEQCLEQKSQEPRYSKIWIVFDRDEVINFNEIINEAEKRDIHVGWSNPCIETWFCAYFDKMSFCLDSQNCCSSFCGIFMQRTKQEYKKSDPHIYRKLNQAGDEDKAIKIAEQKLQSFQNQKPSDMNPSTTLHILVKEIKAHNQD